jgi:hypothetical protein
MSKKTQTRPAQPPKPKTFIVYGADEYAKPRAARFSGDDPNLLAKAVETMQLRMVEVTGDELADIAAKLPAGRLHANGRGLVPYVRGDLYLDLIAETLGDEEPPAHPDLTVQDLPRSWDDIAPGHVVIAKETLECGWWEAIVVERNGDLVTLRYRDYPQYLTMVRHRSAVALINAPAP